LEEAAIIPLDQTIRTYVRAAQDAFLAGNYLATMSLLAGAGERCIDLLEAVVFDDTDETSSSWIPTLQRIIARLASMEIAADLREEIGLQLDGLRTLIGHTRDGDGSPRAVAIDHETAYAALLLFPRELQAVHRLISGTKDRSRE